MSISGIAGKGIRALGSIGVGALAHLTQEPHLGWKAVAGSLAFVVGHVFTHFGAELTTHLSHDIIERAGKNPRLLNHHLQKLFLNAVHQSICEGVVTIYEDRHKVKLNKELKDQLRKLSRSFDQAFDINNNKPLSSSELISLLSEDKHADNYSNLFSGRVDREYEPLTFFNSNEFPADFVHFFEINLMPVIRIYFIEGLKSKEYEKARIAYEQMMAEETFKGLQEIKQVIAELKATGNLSTSKYAHVPEREFTVSVERIYSPEQLQPIFNAGLREFFGRFDQKLDEVIILESDTNKKVNRIDSKTDKIEKGVKKGLVLTFSLVIIATVVSIMAFYYYSKKDTFDATIEIRDENNKALSQGSVAILYGIKKEKVSINADGMGTVAQIPSHFEQDSVELLLIGELEKNYLLDASCSKILLKPGETIHVKVKGKILDTSKGPQGPLVYHPPVAPGGNKRPANTADITMASQLDGSTYSDSRSEDELTLSRIADNIMSFHGKSGMYTIFGKVRVSGRSLMVIDGTVTGNLTLQDGYNLIKGLLIIKDSKAGRDFAVTRN